VRHLARHVDDQPLARAAKLPELEVPAEIHPFVSSIRRLVGELALALERQQRFVANAAHELRSPVAALSLQATNLANVLADPAARDRMRPLSQGIARLQALLEQLLSMARVQLHRSGAGQRVNLAELVTATLPEFVPQAADGGIDLGLGQLAPDAVVIADRFDLELVLRNVIANALKFCPRGSEVTLDLVVADGLATLTVTDDGPGLAPDELALAFEPFFRATSADAPGSGLGLAIVAAVAERLEAQVSLRANPRGRGLVFAYRQALAT
jgi:signal transduction histidine kinase